ncbi:hypothetical protein ACPOL_4648 [Acidisarcina polymorpha]|uniref:Glycoside hydrolase family 5 domain-containing protein n=1 Tax=Acidisarcina polymorpha TaxID=2211140 RepID=A0A2Z5G484_9BACT|nr:hypothetical protein [Acidisarcina polymorpha]AXC13918.1 hypothetical protein ACPOL_4648 [Acidisarcina polymorpha]
MTRIIFWNVVAIVFIIFQSACASEPIRQNPDNPHYFLFRGKPTVLVTSGEHYGAVLNGDFDYVRYLDELHANRLNYTRLFSGVYFESPGDFGIVQNTLAPDPAALLLPWARSLQPGYVLGGNKFDLNSLDAKYLARLKDFLAKADERGIVVELVLFSVFYQQGQWDHSPMNAANNINGIGICPREKALTLDNGNLLAAQELFIRQLMTELNAFDNLYYELVNEPWTNISNEWIDHMINVAATAEDSLPKRHLIAHDVPSKPTEAGARYARDNAHISVLNMHYERDLKNMSYYYPAGKVLSYDETGFDGNADHPYHVQAWQYMLAGGGVYDNLDYSFVVGHENGSAQVAPGTPGGGSVKLRLELSYLKAFLESFDLVKLNPAEGLVAGGVPDGGLVRVLAEPGRQYAIYIRGGSKTTLQITLPKGSYTLQWLNTMTGATDKSDILANHPGGPASLPSPPYSSDIALSIRTALAD